EPAEALDATRYGRVARERRRVHAGGGDRAVERGDDRVRRVAGGEQGPRREAHGEEHIGGFRRRERERRLGVLHERERLRALDAPAGRGDTFVAHAESWGMSSPWTRSSSSPAPAPASAPPWPSASRGTARPPSSSPAAPGRSTRSPRA